MALPEDHVDAEGAELLRIVGVMLDGVALRAHRIHHRLRRYARGLRFEPVGVGVLHLVNEPRRGHERLGRHAAGPEAVAAEFLALDQRNLAAEARTAGGGDQAAAATADDDDVELFGHVCVNLIWSGEGGVGCGSWVVVGCRLSVVGCRLSVVGCRLSVVGCRLSVVGCRLSGSISL